MANSKKIFSGFVFHIQVKKSRLPPQLKTHSIINVKNRLKLGKKNRQSGNASSMSQSNIKMYSKWMKKTGS